jgi:DNA polymerase (family 10)
MPIQNTDIAAVFDEIADFLEIGNENPFRIRAYRNAARTVRGLGPELRDMVAQKDNLTQLPGIGKELAAKIVEILETGTARALEKLQANYPQTLRNLLKIPGLGPKRVGILFQDLGIHSMAQLIEAARTGKISSLSGFGTRTERQILQTAESFVQKKRRFKIAEVKPHADRLTAYLETVPGINQVIVAGSYRRAKETVGDLDILVTARKGSPVMDRFVKYDDVEKVLSQGRTRSSVVLRTGLQVDLRLVKSVSFGAALQYFTGSQAHNIAIRRIGRQKGLKINEYGVFTFEKSVAGKTEASVYKALDLPYIPPELRESRGEIEAARDGNLPKLVKLTDIKGDLHIHTDYTDGQNSLREMALAARKRGLKYIAVTEHSDRLKAAGGADPPDLLAQMEEIDRLNEELDGIEILKGLEVEILPDGQLDLPDSVLSRLDLVVGTIHNQLDLSLEKQTRRILHGMDHPHFTFFAHPFGRLINEREPIQVDMMRIIRKARERGCYLELNANIRRLDLYDTYCKIAREEGVLIAINSDAHNIAALDHMQYGVGQARRGWLEKKDVLNTRPLKELRKLLKQTM